MNRKKEIITSKRTITKPDNRVAIDKMIEFLEENRDNPELEKVNAKIKLDFTNNRFKRLKFGRIK